MTNITARHELTITGQHSIGPWYVAKCDCASWASESGDHDQILEDYQTHLDVIDEAERCEARLDNAAAHAVDMGTA